MSRINSLETPGNQFIAAYSELFQGRLGTMKGEYCIKLRPGAQSFSLSTPRRIALPLLLKIKSEFEHMEKLSVITKVEKPTDWCSGIVVVP